MRSSGASPIRSDTRALHTRVQKASSRFASMLEEELEKRGPMGPRPLQQAPMRVLSGANMPAALVEIAYLSNADEERTVQSGDFQASVVQAMYDAIVRFRAYLEAPTAP